jgi:hypothetical protein
MKIIAGLFLLAVCAAGARAQQHAPTADVCRADVAVWFSREIFKEYESAEIAFLRDDVPNRSEIAKLPLSEVTERAQEMLKCMSVDKKDLDTYTNAQDFYQNVIYERYFRFVLRHHLKDQLMREDAQGLR